MGKLGARIHNLFQKLHNRIVRLDHKYRQQSVHRQLSWWFSQCSNNQKWKCVVLIGPAVRVSALLTAQKSELIASPRYRPEILHDASPLIYTRARPLRAILRSRSSHLNAVSLGNQGSLSHPSTHSLFPTTTPLPSEHQNTLPSTTVCACDSTQRDHVHLPPPSFGPRDSRISRTVSPPPLHPLANPQQAHPSWTPKPKGARAPTHRPRKRWPHRRDAQHAGPRRERAQHPQPPGMA